MAGRITTADDIKQLGTIMSIWAHPDDESFLAAGIMAAAVKNGQKVVCVTATKGEAGSQDEQKWPSATLGDVRAKEMAAAQKIIGIKHHHWLEFRDGMCEQASEKEAVAKLKKLIERYQPDSILTFGPDGLTGHTDHATVSIWVTKANQYLDPKPKVYHAVNTPEQYECIKPADEKLNIYFNIDKPPIVSRSKCDICFDLSSAQRTVKRKALAAMPSQTEVLLKLFDQKFLDESFASESYISAK